MDAVEYVVVWAGGELLPRYDSNSTLTLAVQQRSRPEPTTQLIVRPRQRPTRRDRDRGIAARRARIKSMLVNGIPLAVIAAELQMRPSHVSRQANR